VRNDPFQAEVAQIALRVSSVHGFALGGGQALVAHGIVDRPTEDVDLFTDIDGGVSAAADTVRAALEDAGLKSFQCQTLMNSPVSSKTSNSA
jgi:hypothetical protein